MTTMVNPGRPPKKWWSKWYAAMKRQYPRLGAKRLRQLTGHIWWNMKPATRARLTRFYERATNPFPPAHRGPTPPRREDLEVNPRRKKRSPASESPRPVRPIQSVLDEIDRGYGRPHELIVSDINREVWRKLKRERGYNPVRWEWQLIAGRGELGDWNWGASGRPLAVLQKDLAELQKHIGQQVLLTGGGGPGGSLAILNGAQMVKQGFVRGRPALKAYLTVTQGVMAGGPNRDQPRRFDPWIDSWQISVMVPVRVGTKNPSADFYPITFPRAAGMAFAFNPVPGFYPVTFERLPGVTYAFNPRIPQKWWNETVRRVKKDHPELDNVGVVNVTRRLFYKQLQPEEHVRRLP